jgi:hypothetical protein
MAARPDRLTEREIRAHLLATLAPTVNNGALLVEEMGVEHGAARVDVALISPSLQGFEIKSDFDTLDRLANQMHAYHGVFDQVTLVSTDGYLAQAEKLLPAWWGLWRVSRTAAGALATQVIRPASHNPRQDSRSVAALLWRDEAAALLELVTGTRTPAGAARAKLYDQLTHACDAATLCQHVVAALIARAPVRGRDRAVVRSTDAPDASSAPDGDWWRHAATW